MSIFFLKSPVYCCYNFLRDLPRIFLDYFLQILLVSFFSIMSTVSSQRRVRQRTEEDRSSLQAKIMDRTVIAERNVVRSDIMVPPLDSIYDTIQTYYWGY
jgi:membrane protein implicated in regulation of membrane protease activity